MATPTLDVEHEKDLRRRGAELDMAHKEYDRLKGHFHSRKARSTCTECHAFRPSRRHLPATDKSELVGATNRRRVYLHYDLDDIHAPRPSNGAVAGLLVAEPTEKYDDDIDGSVVPAPHTETTLAHIAVRPTKKRKGLAADFEFVPNPSHGVLALDDDVDSDDQARGSDQDDFERVDSDGDTSTVANPATPQRSYASAVRNATA